MVAALHVVVGGLVGGDHAGAGTGLDRHVADRHAALHRERADRGAAVLQHVTLSTAGADLRDHGQDDVLRRHPRAQRALDRDRHRLEGLERQGLRREDVLDLGRADAERHRAEGPVGAGVRVAADHGDAGHGQAELRTDHVDDALLLVAQGVQPDAELLAVATEGLDLDPARRVRDGAVDGERRGVVVLGRDRQVEATHRTPGLPQAVERLRTRHLVHEVEVDVEEVGVAVLALDHDVVVPHLLGERLSHEAQPSSSSSLRRDRGPIRRLYHWYTNAGHPARRRPGTLPRRGLEARGDSPRRVAVGGW